MAQPTGPYRIGSLRYDVSCVLTNKVQQGFFRGAGADPGNFILERLVDAAAEELGIDRAELRRRNFIQPDEFPYKIPTGNVYDSGNYEAVLDRALEIADLTHWQAEQERLRAEGRYLGIGLASCQERSGYNASEWWFLYDNPPLPATSTPESVQARRRRHGRRPGRARAARCGATARRPSSARSSAEEFGIDPAAVAVAYADSTSGRDVGRAGRQPADDHAVRGGPRRVAHGPGQDDPHRRARDGDEPRRRRVRRRHVPREGRAGHVDDDGRGRACAPTCSSTTTRRASSSGLVDDASPTTTRTPRRPSADRTDMGAFYPMVSHACHIPIVEVDPETGAGHRCSSTTW